MMLGLSGHFFAWKCGLPEQRVTHPALPVQSSLLLEHDDRPASTRYIRAMLTQESVPYEFLQLLDGAEPGFAHEYLRRMDDFTQ